jgi:hypothetical protein
MLLVLNFLMMNKMAGRHPYIVVIAPHKAVLSAVILIYH